MRLRKYSAQQESRSVESEQHSSEEQGQEDVKSDSWILLLRRIEIRDVNDVQDGAQVWIELKFKGKSSGTSTYAQSKVFLWKKPVRKKEKSRYSQIRVPAGTCAILIRDEDLVGNNLQVKLMKRVEGQLKQCVGIGYLSLAGIEKRREMGEDVHDLYPDENLTDSSQNVYNDFAKSKSLKKNRNGSWNSEIVVAFSKNVNSLFAQSKIKSESKSPVVLPYQKPLVDKDVTTRILTLRR